MSFQKRKGGRQITKQYTINKSKPKAEWDEQDQRYYMPGEKIRLSQSKWHDDLSELLRG